MKKIMYLLIMINCLILPFNVYAEESAKTSEDTMTVTLEKCVDGDTATFKDDKGNTYKTRFLAIDTRETVHPTKGEQAYGKEASTYTCDSLTNAKEIVLEFDSNSDKEDKYGRLLAWVFVDGILLQESLISEGLAEVAYLYDDYKYTEKLETAQETAKSKKIGIWQLEKVVDEESDLNNASDDLLSENDKTFIDKIIDSLLGKIFDYINEILDNIATEIENML